MPKICSVSSGLHLLGESRLAMMFVQPKYELIQTGTSFQYSGSYKQHLLRTHKAWIDQTKSHQPHFIALPEYSLPLELVDDIEAAINGQEWHLNSVIVAGLEPMTIDQFQALMATSDNPEDVRYKDTGPATFVNVVCTWIKSNDGKVKRFLQPKLRPNKQEHAIQGMLEGEHVFVFTSELVSFMSLVCFDGIAVENMQSMADQLVSDLVQGVQEGFSRRIDLIFLIQHNNRPEHPEFLFFAEKMLHGGPGLKTELNCAVAFVNSAHAEHGRALEEDFGRSAIYYHKRDLWKPADHGPITDIPNTFALEKPEHTSGLVRARFREDGPCIHKFLFYVPSLIGGHSGEARVPLAEARCQLIVNDGSLEGSGNSVPALGKVVSDWIRVPLPQGDARFNGELALRELLLTKYLLVRSTFAKLSGDRLEQICTLLFAPEVPAHSPAKWNPDKWQDHASGWFSHVRGQALIELVSVVVVLSLCVEVTLEIGDHTHTGKIIDSLFTVLDGADSKGFQEIRRSYAEWLKRSPWGGPEAKRNIVILTRCPVMSAAPILQPFDLSYLTTNKTEMLKLPAQIQPNDESILTSTTPMFWIAAANVRGALMCDSVEAAKAFLRTALELN